MRIEILKLALSNFKGVQTFDIDLQGQDAIVSGSNGTGKTTIFDAWLWLLFDMDSRGNKGAEAVKTTAGTDFVHYLTHEVTAEITVEGKAHTLRKSLEENWVKPRGKAEQEFAGNVSNYWIDDIPRKQKEYQAYIDSLIPAELFKIISDPMYFSAAMKWQDRLSWLVDVSGGITEEEVAQGDKDLEALLVKMGDKSMQDYRKMVQEQIRKLNNEIDSIPARIDEQKRSIPATQDYKQVEADLKTKREELAVLESAETNAKESIKPMLALQDQIFRLRAQRNTSIDTIIRQKNADRLTASQRQQELVSEIKHTVMQANMIRDAMGSRQARVDTLNAECADLRTKFAEIRTKIQALNTDEFVPPELDDVTCPTCGQKLPTHMLNEKAEKLRTVFESERMANIMSLQKQLEQINQKGKDNAAKIKELLAQNDADIVDIEEMGARGNELDAEVKKLSASVASSPVYLPAMAEQEPQVKDIDSQILTLEMKLTATPEDRSGEAQAKKSAVRAEIDRLNGILYAQEAAKKGQERIAELEADLRGKSATKTLLEGDIFQCERFVRARTEKLEGKINGMFTKVGFKLFAEQVNGGLTETCEAVVNNTTFGKANTAGQINAGMDIIRTISRFKNIYVPVFVDHLESINDLLPLSSQVVSLLVSRETGLNVTVNSNKQEVA